MLESSTGPDGSRPGSGKTSSCSTAALPRATPCACSGASRASTTGCSSRSARLRRPTTIRPASLRANAPRRGRARRLSRVPRGRALALRHWPRCGTAPRRRRDSRSRCGNCRPPRHTTPTPAACSNTPSAWRLWRVRPAQLHPAPPRRPPARGGAPARPWLVRELGRGPSFRPTDEGRLLGHVHLGLRLVEERAAEALDRTRARSSCTRSPCTTTRNAARTAEAAVLYHANQLDAVAATRPVGD